MSSKRNNKENGDEPSSSTSRSSTSPSALAKRDKAMKSLFESLVGADRNAALSASQLARVEWIGRTLGQLFTDSARVDASGEPPRASQFNHVELEEIDVNLFRAKKEDLW